MFVLMIVKLYHNFITGGKTQKLSCWHQRRKRERV